MPGNPRQNTGNKGFWDGGSKGHGAGKESSGRSSGFPGRRKPSNAGVRIDLERPATPATSGEDKEPQSV